MNLLKNKFEFLWQKEIPPSEFDKMDFWEFEIYISLMNDRNKEENKKHKEQQEDQESKTPKMPNLNSFNPSSFKPPKF